MFESNVTEGGQIMQSVKVTFCNMKMLLQHCKKKKKKKKKSNFPGERKAT